MAVDHPLLTHIRHQIPNLSKEVLQLIETSF